MIPPGNACMLITNNNILTCLLCAVAYLCSFSWHGCWYY